METPTCMIEVNDLHRSFGALKAVAGISFCVRRGEIFGLLGPNGAGKSTTIRMLTGQINPDKSPEPVRQTLFLTLVCYNSSSINALTEPPSPVSTCLCNRANPNTVEVEDEKKLVLRAEMLALFVGKEYSCSTNAVGKESIRQDNMCKDITTGTTMINVKSVALCLAIAQGDGSGPPLLLINGLGANLELFDPFIEALDNVGEHKIGTIRFDIPGIGGSPPLRYPLSFNGLARLISEMLDGVGHQEVDVLGISWGGALAQQFAHQYPSRCRRLILVSTSTGGISVPGKLSGLSKLLSPRRSLDLSSMAAMAPLFYSDTFRQDTEQARSSAQLSKAPYGRGYLMQLLAGVGWTSIPWLHRLRQPTLILAGKDDAIVPPINARILARLIPHATLHLLHGGHLFALTEKEQVASLVYAFLRDESTSGKKV